MTVVTWIPLCLNFPVISYFLYFCTFFLILCYRTVRQNSVKTPGKDLIIRKIGIFVYFRFQRHRRVERHLKITASVWISGETESCTAKWHQCLGRQIIYAEELARGRTMTTEDGAIVTAAKDNSLSPRRTSRSTHKIPRHPV